MVAQLVLGMRWQGKRNQTGIRILEDGLMLKAQEECGAGAAQEVYWALGEMSDAGLIDLAWRSGKPYAVYRFGMSVATARRRAACIKMWKVEVIVPPEKKDVHTELRKMGFTQMRDEKSWVKGYGPDGWQEDGITAEVRLEWGEESVVVVAGPRGSCREWGGMDVTAAMATIRAWNRMLGREKGSVLKY